MGRLVGGRRGVDIMANPRMGGGWKRHKNRIELYKYEVLPEKGVECPPSAKPT